jgi:hypothetical protein
MDIFERKSALILIDLSLQFLHKKHKIFKNIISKFSAEEEVPGKLFPDLTLSLQISAMKKLIMHSN